MAKVNLINVKIKSKDVIEASIDRNVDSVRLYKMAIMATLVVNSLVLFSILLGFVLYFLQPYPSVFLYTQDGFVEEINSAKTNVDDAIQTAKGL